MRGRTVGTAALAAAVGAAVCWGGPARADENVVTYAVSGAFDDIRLDLETAILNRGLVIDYEAFVGEMLRRTGADIGAASEIFTRAESFQFCSAVLSRRMMEADPVNIGLCPHIVFAYELPAEPGKVYVGYRRLPGSGSEASRAAQAEINGLLDGIAREAAGLN